MKNYRVELVSRDDGAVELTRFDGEFEDRRILLSVGEVDALREFFSGEDAVRGKRGLGKEFFKEFNAEHYRLFLLSLREDGFDEEVWGRAVEHTLAVDRSGAEVEVPVLTATLARDVVDFYQIARENGG